jgi:diphthine synthase
MGEIVFVGLGLHDEMDVSLKGLEEVKTADAVFIECYTSILPGFSLRRFEKLSGRTLRIVSRRELEEENGEAILKVAEKGKAVLLVPGDPFVATTHMALRIEANRRGIKTRIIHGASIISAVVGLCGLQNYKFGRSVTIPFPENYSETPYEVIAKNRKLGLHTLCFLDIDAEAERYLIIRDALKMLLETEEKRRMDAVTRESLAVGIARAGSPDPIVKADYVGELIFYDFGKPPHTLAITGKLHFMEAEALIAFAKAPISVRRMIE